MVNECPENVEPVYLGIVNVDTAYSSAEHCPTLLVTPFITMPYLFLAKK